MENRMEKRLRDQPERIAAIVIADQIAKSIMENSGLVAHIISQVLTGASYRTIYLANQKIEGLVLCESEAVGRKALSIIAKTILHPKVLAKINSKKRKENGMKNLESIDRETMTEKACEATGAHQWQSEENAELLELHSQPSHECPCKNPNGEMNLQLLTEYMNGKFNLAFNERRYSTQLSKIRRKVRQAQGNDKRKASPPLNDEQRDLLQVIVKDQSNRHQGGANKGRPDWGKVTEAMESRLGITHNKETLRQALTRKRTSTREK